MDPQQYERPDELRPNWMRRRIAGIGNFLRQFSFKREFDMTSIAAFVLSMVVAVLTIGPHFRGPDLKLATPLAAILFAEDFNGAEATFKLRQPQVRFIVETSVVNLAAAGIQAIVEKETVDFTLGDTTYHQEWRYGTLADTERYHVHFCPDEPALKKLADEKGPLIGFRYDEKTVSDKAPVVFGCHSERQKLILWERRPLQRIVPGSSAVSQQVVFEGPGTDRKILPVENFSAFLAANLSKAKGPDQKVEPTLKITVYEPSGQATWVECKFTIRENERRLFADRGWLKIERFDRCTRPT